MKSYLDLLGRVLKDGDVKNPARENMPRTKELFAETIKCDLQQGFPLLTTKKMFTKGVLEELLWFLRGSTCVRELMRAGVHIWDEDVYKLYKKRVGSLSFEDWKDKEHIRAYDYDAGSIYGKLWRDWAGVDQVYNLVQSILKTPDSRYQIVTAWNPAIAKWDMALPSCHLLWQTNVRGGEFLDLVIYQRSCDMFLGVPFNIASYAFLTHLLARLTGYKAGVLTWVGGSVHVYENQVNACLEQLSREPKELPTVSIDFNDAVIEDCVSKAIQVRHYDKSDFDNLLKVLTREMFKIVGYESHDKIEAPLSTGLELKDFPKVW